MATHHAAIAAAGGEGVGHTESGPGTGISSGSAATEAAAAAAAVVLHAAGSGVGSIKGVVLDTGVVLTPAAVRGVRVGIVRTEWNTTIIDALTVGAVEELVHLGVAAADIVVHKVPGSYELPLAVRLLLDTGRVDAVIAIGCLIKGETMHFEYICEAVSQGIMRLNLDSRCPVIFGVLACLTEEQARARAGLSGGHGNHGKEWAQTALKMVLLRRALAAPASPPAAGGSL